MRELHLLIDLITRIVKHVYTCYFSMLELPTKHTYWLWFYYSDKLCLSELRETLIHYNSSVYTDFPMLRIRVWLRMWIASFRAAIFTFLPIIRHCRILLIAVTPRVFSVIHKTHFMFQIHIHETHVFTIKSKTLAHQIPTIIYHMTAVSSY